MKHYILPLIVLPLVAHGQITEPDTVTVKELGEVTVVADAQRTSATKTVYIPACKPEVNSIRRNFAAFPYEYSAIECKSYCRNCEDS